VNPYDEAAQQQLARAMIQDGRYQDAHAHYQKMLVLFPHDADALLDDGVLAAELGNADEAKDAWERALAADPNEIYAHMYLASLFDQRRDYKTAVQHWYAFLQLASNRRQEEAIAPDEEIPALVQLSDDEERLNEPDAAMTGYQSAVALAERAGSFKVQSLALVHLANAQEKRGDVKSAADSYQKALAADAKSNDATSSGSDWFDYGQFLERHGKPDDLVYACVLQAQELLKPAGGPALDAVVTERNTLEARLGPAAAARAQKNKASLIAAAVGLADSSF
jgi:tetratricopeptide (TPR) repeat protein